MCQFSRSNSFEYQDTLLGSRHTSNGSSPVDGKFIQIVNPNNSHWVCLFNALAFIREPYVVEIFDSLRTPKSLETCIIIDRCISSQILQLRPQTTVVRFVRTQIQDNGYDCSWHL